MNPVVAPRVAAPIPPIIPPILVDPITRQDVTEAVEYKLQVAKRRKIDPEAVPLDLLVEATIAENKVCMIFVLHSLTVLAVIIVTVLMIGYREIC